MPLYDFRCRACGQEFESRTPVGETAPCPACGSPETERVPSPFAGPFTVGMRGYVARRSNANRAAREEQRREAREQRRQQRAERPKPSN